MFFQNKLASAPQARIYGRVQGVWTPALLPDWPNYTLYTPKKKSVELAIFWIVKISLWTKTLCENHSVMWLYYNRFAILNLLPVLCYALGLCYLMSVMLWNFVQGFFKPECFPKRFKKVLLCVYIIVLRSCICCLWCFGTLFRVSSNLIFFLNFQKGIVHQLLN